MKLNNKKNTVISVFYKEGLSYSPSKDNDARCHKPVASLLFYSECSLCQFAGFMLGSNWLGWFLLNSGLPPNFSLGQVPGLPPACLFEKTPGDLEHLWSCFLSSPVNQGEVAAGGLMSWVRVQRRGSSRRKLAAVGRQAEGRLCFVGCQEMCVRDVSGVCLHRCPAKTTASPASRTDYECCALGRRGGVGCVCGSQHQMAGPAPPSGSSAPWVPKWVGTCFGDPSDALERSGMPGKSAASKAGVASGPLARAESFSHCLHAGERRLALPVCTDGWGRAWWGLWSFCTLWNVPSAAPRRVDFVFPAPPSCWNPMPLPLCMWL